MGRGGQGRRIHVGHARVELVEVGFPEIAYYLGVVSWRPRAGRTSWGGTFPQLKQRMGMIMVAAEERSRELWEGALAEKRSVGRGGRRRCVQRWSVPVRRNAIKEIRRGRGRTNAKVARRSDPFRRKLSPTFGGCVRKDTKH
jgi:hypothetical protein